MPFREYRIGTRLFFRRASVVMACHVYEAALPKTGNHEFVCSWTRSWLFYKLTLSERFYDRP